MAKITTGDLAKLTGYTERQIGNLCASGVLIPERTGDGPGCFRMFSIMQVLGITFGAQWAGIGCSRELVERVMDFITDHSEASLRREFKAGRTHLIPRASGRMALIEWKSAYGEVFDLKAAYDDVIQSVEKVAKEPGNFRVDARGRRRGLEGTVER